MIEIFRPGQNKTMKLFIVVFFVVVVLNLQHINK